MSTLTAKLLLFSYLQTIVITITNNELCDDDRWNIVHGIWSYSNCTLQSFNEYHNQTVLIWFGEDSSPWTSYDEYYNHKFFTLELSLSINLNLSHYKENEVENLKLHTGIIWRTQRVSNDHNVGSSYYYGVFPDGETKFGLIHDGWDQSIDSDNYIPIHEFISTHHVLRVDAIGPIYRFYLDDIFEYEQIDTVFNAGTIGIRSKRCPATYYSLDMNVLNISDINLTYTDIVYCNDYIMDEIMEYKMSYYQLIVTERKKIVFDLYGMFSRLKFYLFDADFDVIIDCKVGIDCDENEIYINSLNPGHYTIAIGAPNSDSNDPYNISIICQPPILQSESSLHSNFVGSVAFFVVLIIAFCVSLGLIPFLYCYFNKKTKKLQKLHLQTECIKNGLAVIISIGNYDKLPLNPDPEISNEHLSDIDVVKDVDNLMDVFKLLNYKIMPKELKTNWKESEVITYLKDKVGAEISKKDENMNLFYDALIVCITCHGMKNTIITSDYRSIEKTVLHRIISIRYPETREIPRIFLFDSCEGTAERKKSLIRPPTINIEEFKNNEEGMNYDEETGKNMEYEYKKQKTNGKGIGLNDGLNDWRGKNPDYKLAEIHGANKGFQAKFNMNNGSYLMYEFTQKMKINIMNNEDKTLCEIFQEIQTDLHDRGKQQIIKIFNNDTQNIVFHKKKERERLQLKKKRKSPVITRRNNKQTLEYKTVNNDDDDDNDNEILIDTLQDVLRMPSISTSIKNES